MSDENRLYPFETTVRDGQQAHGFDFAAAVS
jgi:hypothetical protein